MLQKPEERRKRMRRKTPEKLWKKRFVPNHVAKLRHSRNKTALSIGVTPITGRSAVRLTVCSAI